MSDEARALTMAVLGRPKGYDPALLIGEERAWSDAKLPLILAALLEAKAQGMEEAVAWLRVQTPKGAAVGRPRMPSVSDDQLVRHLKLLARGRR